MGLVPLLPQQVGGQSYPGEKPHQGRRSAGDGPIGPLALGFHAQVRPSLHEGNFQLPAQHKPFQNLHRGNGRVSTQQRLRSEFALGVPNPESTEWTRMDGVRTVAGG